MKYRASLYASYNVDGTLPEEPSFVISDLKGRTIFAVALQWTTGGKATRLDVNLTRPESATIYLTNGGAVAIAPDGKYPDEVVLEPGTDSEGNPVKRGPGRPPKAS